MTNDQLKASILTALADADEILGATYDRRGTWARREEIRMTMHVLRGMYWELAHRVAGPYADMIGLGQKVWMRAANEPFMDGIQKDWHDRAFFNHHCEMMGCSVESVLLQSLEGRSGQVP